MVVVVVVSVEVDEADEGIVLLNKELDVVEGDALKDVDNYVIVVGNVLWDVDADVVLGVGLADVDVDDETVVLVDVDEESVIIGGVVLALFFFL